jgi:ubiquinone/menaquinone biosynthesis C-methylase UbiE
MNLWDSFWKSGRHLDFFVRIGRLIPAGPWDFHWRWKRYNMFLQGLGIRNPRIVELGCGTGIMTFRMLQEYGGEAVLVDSSEEALRTARKCCRDMGIPDERVTFAREDVFSFRDSEGFDIVHSQGLIEHFPDQSRIIEQHTMLARKGGHVLILAPRPSIFYRSFRKLYEYVYGSWLFGYENPLHTDKVVEMVRRTGTRIKRKRNFMFSMGCLAERL